MKNTLKKLGVATIVLVLCGSSLLCAAAEPVAETTPTPTAAVESKAPAEESKTTAPTTEVTAEPTEVATEEPATEVTVAPTTEVTTAPTTVVTAEPTEVATEEPATEETAAPTTEATTEPTAEPTEVAADEPTTEPTVEPTPAPFVFTGTAKVEMENEGEIFYGDEIVLRVRVSNANAAYTIRWEKSDDGQNWSEISGEHDVTYRFTVTEQNAGLAYRAVLVVAE